MNHQENNQNNQNNQVNLNTISYNIRSLILNTILALVFLPVGYLFRMLSESRVKSYMRNKYISIIHKIMTNRSTLNSFGERDDGKTIFYFNLRTFTFIPKESGLFGICLCKDGIHFKLF